MSNTVYLSDNIIREAKISAKINNSSITEQIEYWIKVGRIAEDNPELPYRLIKDILMGIEELDSGKDTEYNFCYK